MPESEWRKAYQLALQNGGSANCEHYIRAAISRLELRIDELGLEKYDYSWERLEISAAFHKLDELRRTFRETVQNHSSGT